MNGDLLNRVAAFANRYDALLEQERETLGLAQWTDLRNDWRLGLHFFLNRAFYQGRRDEVSQVFREATNEALASLLPEQALDDKAARLLRWAHEGWFQRANWDQDANPIRQMLDQRYHVEIDGQQHWSSTGKSGDRKMVTDILGFICTHPAVNAGVLNIADYTVSRVEAGAIEEVYQELNDIFQVKQKVASFFLRDLVTVLALQGHLAQTAYQFLQPADTWVRQIAARLNIQPGQHGLAVALAEACQVADIDPIRFNQGAWYLGKHSFDVVLENLERIEP